MMILGYFFKQKTAYEMRISDWSSACALPIYYHAGIRTYPFQVAVARNIPLMVWGEHGFAELTGIVTLEDFVEFTKWSRKDHDMPVYEPDDLIVNVGITHVDFSPYFYPIDSAFALFFFLPIYFFIFFFFFSLFLTPF